MAETDCHGQRKLILTVCELEEPYIYKVQKCHNMIFKFYKNLFLENRLKSHVAVDCRVINHHPKKIFSAHNDRGDMNCREKWFPRKLLKFLTKNFFGQIRVILNTYIGRLSPRFRTRIYIALTIEEACPPRSHYSQCNKGQARAQNFFSPISINLVSKVV